MSLALESPHLQSAASLTQADSALPLSEAYAEILPHGLLRGQVVVCHGVAAYSIALGLVERAVTVGSWLAVVDLEQVSPEAIAEFGIPLHRVIGVTTGDDPANVLSAVFDGFDVVLIPAHRYRGALARRISQRIRAKGVTLIVIDDADEVGVRDAVSLGDVALIGSDMHWEGIGWGVGRLLARHLTVSATGRRSPRPLRSEMQLPAAVDVRVGQINDAASDVGDDIAGATVDDDEEYRWRFRVV